MLSTVRLSMYCLLLLAMSPLMAQSPAPAPTLATVLQGVREHVTAYRKSMPSFEAQESVVSERFDGFKVKSAMQLESTLRTVRHPGLPLQEERVQQTVDGKPAVVGKVATPPYSYDGGFATVLGFIENKCGDYRFASGTTASSNPIVIVMLPRVMSTDGLMCAANPYEGKFLVDPETLYVKRMEYKMQDIFTNSGMMAHMPFTSSLSGHNTFSLVVNYEPIPLAGRTYWLPATVEATLADKKKPVSLHYVAKYSKYHKFGATATIVGVGENPEATPPQ